MKRIPAILAMAIFSTVVLARIAPIILVLDANTPKGPLPSGAVNASLLRLDVTANGNARINISTFRIDVTGKVTIVNLKLFCDGVQLGQPFAVVVPGKPYDFYPDFTMPAHNTKVLEVRGDVGGNGTIKVTMTQGAGVEINNAASIYFPENPVLGKTIRISRRAK
jgi:hypothetical protein